MKTNHLMQSYRKRFPERFHASRSALWRTLIRVWFGQYVKPSDTVMDIGAGYCELINSIACTRRIAVDPNPDTKRHAGPGVMVLGCDATAIPKKYNGTIDVLFMSNILEHLPTKQAVFEVLIRARQLMKIGGTIVIIQPNIDLVKERYWDFFDHQVALNGRSVSEALESSGFHIETYIERFLPYTTKGSLPTWSWLVPVYLAIPSIIRPFAGQSLFIAKK